MKIHLIRERVTREQLDEMLATLKARIKLAVDVERGILAGGGEMHADCEAILLEDGSRQENVWGADWYPTTQAVGYESLINIRSRQNNPSLELLDTELRQRVEQITVRLLGDV